MGGWQAGREHTQSCTLLGELVSILRAMGALRSPELMRDRWNSCFEEPSACSSRGPAPPTHSVVAGINSSPREGPRL